MQISEMTTKVPTYGVLAGLDASLVIKVGNFVNVSADLSAWKMLHKGVCYRERDQGWCLYLHSEVSGDGIRQ